MFDIKDELAILEQIKNLPEVERNALIDIYKLKLISNERVEKEKSKHRLIIRTTSIFFGSVLGVASLYLASHAINSKASLLELAALFTPIAALAGVFLWGFQRKD